MERCGTKGRAIGVATEAVDALGFCTTTWNEHYVTDGDETR